VFSAYLVCSVVPILEFCSTLLMEQIWGDFWIFEVCKCLFYIYNIYYLYSSSSVCSVVPCFLIIGVCSDDDDCIGKNQTNKTEKSVKSIFTKKQRNNGTSYIINDLRGTKTALQIEQNKNSVYHLRKH